MGLFKWNFNISFCQINPSFYLNKDKLKKYLGKLLGKRCDSWYISFGICLHTSCTTKFWHTYVIKHNNFMIIVGPPCVHHAKKHALFESKTTMTSFIYIFNVIFGFSTFCNSVYRNFHFLQSHFFFPTLSSSNIYRTMFFHPFSMNWCQT